jgi:hypothetical protein
MEKSDSSLSMSTLAAQRTESEEILAYHVLLLKEAGLVEATIHTSSRTRSGHPDAAVMQRLTYAGHEFLDSVRSDTTWNKLKTYVSGKGLELTVDTLMKAVPGFIAAALGS